MIVSNEKVKLNWYGMPLCLDNGCSSISTPLKMILSHDYLIVILYDENLQIVCSLDHEFLAWVAT